MATLPNYPPDNSKKVSNPEPEQLPKDQTPVDLQQLGGAGPNNINWLNSSYSGADIKVVAHLYKNEDEGLLNKLSQDLEVSKLVIEGAYNISNISGASARGQYKSAFEMFNEACFPGGYRTDDLHVAALRTLGLYQPAWYLAVIRNDARAMGTFQVAIEELISSQKSIRDSLQKQIETLKAHSDASSATLSLGHLQTISVQSHREKFAVRALGKSYAQGYTRGPRTIGGSMIFTVFNEHPLRKLIRAMGNAGLYGETSYDTGVATLMPDQLPPIDLTVVFANEYGSLSRMGLYGVEFMNDGMTMSIEDLFTEQVMNFTARDADIMTSVGLVKLSQAEKNIYGQDGLPVKASDLYYSGLDSYKAYLDNLGMRRMFRGR